MAELLQADNDGQRITIIIVTIIIIMQFVRQHKFTEYGVNEIAVAITLVKCNSVL